MYVKKRFFSIGLLFFLLFNLSTNSQSRAVISGVISDEFGGILPGAKVSIEGTDNVTTSDTNGNYKLEVEAGIYIINVSFIMYNSASKSIQVDLENNIILDFTLSAGFSIDEPISLGSRAQPRSLLETTVPVDIISPEQITKSPQLELSQVLHFLIPSFHSTHQTISDGTDHIDPTSLRGLGPDQVLVLVNGKRRHSSSLLNVNGTAGRGSVGTDFNAIPITAIDRIEILRDGATSQYGSDAIAGVINIILKKQTDVIDLNTQFGTNTEGDGKTSYFGINFGTQIGKEGFLNLTGEFRQRTPTNRAGNYTGSVYSNDPNLDAQLINQNQFFSKTGYKNQQVMEIGNSATQNLSFFFNGEFFISTDTRLYFHGGRNYREGISKGFYRFPKDQDRVVLELNPNGFSPQIVTDIMDDAIVAGIKSIKNDWNIDFSQSIGINTLGFNVENSNNASLGISSPRGFNSGGFKYQQSTTNLDLSRKFDQFGDLNIALGGELRLENYQIKAGEEASYINGDSTFIDSNGDVQPRITGAQLFPGIRPENELSRFRTNGSGYFDLEINPSKKLLLEGALRYEFYNDFGSETIWKLASRYRISENLSLRGSYSTGFRAPSLHQVYFQNVSNQFIDGDFKQVGTFNSESAVVNDAFNLDDLKPELSDHISLGISGKVNNTFTFSFDFYQINIEDRIVLSARLEDGFETILTPFNVSSAQFLTNAIDSRTRGFDAVINYKNKIGSGELYGSIAANVNSAKVNNIHINSSLSSNLGSTAIFNREEVSRIESAQPNFKINTLVAYEINKIEFRLHNTYFGEVSYLHPNDGNSNNWVLNEFTGNIESRDQTFSPKILTDFSIGYQLKNWLYLNVGGNNIFNVYPDRHTHSANTSEGNFIYSRRVQQFGVKGANYFFNLNVKL
ncbi:TonB-dependent receptor [Tenacibaculum agarivorans]|uniref:TonB-dependent receptor n=1 Tax=Tenacibaculum agarivorans TaxID=1908389 RepID=UPI000AF3E32D|nr:TonB-dependent receptor [Tenacibaculum agarivorans]